jgi:hypothetical protein
MNPNSPAALWAIALAGLAGLTVLAAVDPATTSWLPPCMFRAATGLLCPGCGSTRAIHALLQGHVHDALQLNPLAVAVLPVTAFELGQRLRGREGLGTHRLRPFFLWALTAGIIAFGIVRNLP